MSLDHGHAHAGQANRQRLGIALALAAAYMAVEIVGGLITGSLALLADAGHMLSDVAALGLALFASWMAGRPSGRRWTYGLARVEILAALAQGVALVLVAVLVGIEAIERLGAPREVMGAGMLMIAAGGLAVNLAGLWILSPGRKSSLNMRGAWLHVLSDALGSVGAILAGALIWAFGWSWADPAASLLIAALIVFSAWHLLRDAVDVLMEAAPRDLDPDQIEQALSELSGVAQVHDLHVWSIGSAGVSLSCHLVDENDPLNPELLSDAYLLLGDRFGIAHATIQIEPKRLAGETPQSLCAGGCPPDN
ncbi:MAG: cation transporter [Myxococcales bacterium]|nr:cation transporter [Myxococcales bacterium]